jgi:hypothetical protein
MNHGSKGEEVIQIPLTAPAEHTHAAMTRPAWIDYFISFSMKAVLAIELAAGRAVLS